MRWLFVSAALVGAITIPVRAEDAPPPARMATFSCDVTPAIDGHPLIWVTPVKTVETPLEARGVVVETAGQRYVVCAIDWCGLCNSSHDLFRGKLAEGAGTEPGHVALQAVHQHTAPYTDGDAQRLLAEQADLPLFVDFAFLDRTAQRLADAARDAFGRLAPFDRVGVGRAAVEQVASSRRIVDAEGKLHTRMSSAKDPATRALPEGLIDPVLRTITLARGDRPLVRMHYYATHPQTFYGDPRASADMPGFARAALEKEEGVFQIYFNGCGGDVAMGKYNDGTPEARTALTARLLDAMKRSVAATEYRPLGPIAWRSVPLVLPARTDADFAPSALRQTIADPKADTVTRIRAATRLAFTQRIERPLDASLFSLGDVAIVHLPGECMLAFQLYAQTLAGNRFLAVAAYGDLGPGYVCTDEAMAQGGYEPSASRAGVGSEAAVRAAIRELLVPGAE